MRCTIRWTSWLICLGMVAVCIAADPAAKPDDLAKDSYDASVLAAQNQYDDAAATAKKTYVTDLNAALDAAMTASNLDEANRIKAEIDALSNGQPSSKEKPKRSEALAARIKYDHALLNAKSAQDKSVAEGRQQYISELQNAVKTAMQNKDLDEANRINSLIEAAKKSPPVAGSTHAKSSNTVTPAEAQALIDKVDQMSEDEWKAIRGTEVMVAGDPHKPCDTGIDLASGKRWLAIPCNEDRWNTSPGRLKDVDYHGHVTDKERTVTGMIFMKLCWCDDSKDRHPVEDGFIIEGKGRLILTTSDLPDSGNPNNNIGQVRVKLLEISSPAPTTNGPTNAPTGALAASGASTPAPVSTDVPDRLNNGDLLSVMDLKRDVVHGLWTKEPSGWANAQGAGAHTLRTPYEPPAEYDFEASITVRSFNPNGCTVVMAIPHEGGGPCVAFRNSKNKAPCAEVVGCKNITRLEGPGDVFEIGKPCHLLVQVRKDKISTFVNEKLVCTAEFDPDTGFTSWGWDYVGEKILGFATIGIAIDLHSLTVTDHGKPGKLVKLPALNDYPTLDAPPPTDKPLQTVNLLKLIPNNQLASWKIDGNTIISQAGKGPLLLKMSYQPPAEYDYRVTFTPETENAGFVLTLNGGNTLFNCVFAGDSDTRCGLEMVRGTFLGNKQNPTCVRAANFFNIDQKHSAVVYVRKTFVAVAIDGKLIIKYATDFSDLGENKAWPLALDRIGLASFGGSIIKFDTLELAEITGAGSPLPPDSENTAKQPSGSKNANGASGNDNSKGIFDQ